MKEKDISDLLKRYEQILISGKNTYLDADEYDELADYYDKLDDIETAKEIVDLGLKIHPNNESLLLRHARYLVYDADYTQALKFLNTHFSSYDFESHLLKTECLLQLGLYAEAYQLTTELLNDDETETAVILSELGFLYIEAEYFDEAILYFEKSLEYDAENMEVLNDLLYAYEAKEDFTSAIRICQQILDNDPYGIEGWLVLGKLYSLQDEYEKAIDAFDFALTLDDTNINVFKLKAHCLILSERIEEAIDILEQCIAINPSDEIPHITLIDCYMNIGRYDNMIDSISKYEVQFCETEESITKKAYALFFKGKLMECQEQINKAILAYPESYITQIAIADLFFKMENYSEAETFYKKALELTDDEYYISTLDQLVSFYIETNNLHKAIEYQEKLVDLVKTSTYQKRLALLYLETGNKDNFKSYINSFPEETLVSFFEIFYPEEQLDFSTINRNYILKRLDDIYESRLLYKNIKY